MDAENEGEKIPCGESSQNEGIAQKRARLAQDENQMVKCAWQESRVAITIGLEIVLGCGLTKYECRRVESVCNWPAVEFMSQACLGNKHRFLRSFVHQFRISHGL